EAQRRLHLLRSRPGLHHLPRAPAPVPYLAVLGEQRRHPRSLGADLPHLPRFRSGRTDLRRGDHPPPQSDSPVTSAEPLMSEELRRRVLELYEEADRAVAAPGPVCVASGRCCRFKEYGHVLFLSNLEADVLLAQAPPYEAPVTADFCPFQKQNLCTA